MNAGIGILPDSDLVVAMARGEHSAMTELRRRYALTLYAKAYSIVFDPATSESVVGGVFDEVWRNAAAFQTRGPGSVHGWLLALVYALTASTVHISA